MANRLQRVAQEVYVPAIEAVPSRPPYCVSVPVYGPYGGLIGNGGAPVQPYGAIPNGYSGVSYAWSYSPYKPVARTLTTCYPGTAGRPAVPARTDYANTVGWGAGGRSIDPVENAGFFRCTLPPSPVGIQVGFCGRQLDHLYGSMRHSLVARRDAFTVVELGAVVFGPQPLPASAQIDIRRVNGVVSYVVDGDVVYTSAVPSVGEAYGGVLLYSVGDYVDSPVIGSTIAPIEFSASLPQLIAAISDTADYSAVLADIPPIGFSATLDPVLGGISFSAELPGLVAAISDTADANRVVAVLPAMGFQAVLGAPEEMPSSMVAVLPPPILSAVLLSGQSIEFSAVLPLAFAVAEIELSRVDAVMPIRYQMATSEPYLPANEVDGSDAAFIDEQHVLETALLLLAIDSLDVASTEASLVIVLELVGLDALDVSDSTTIGAIVEMLAMEQVAIVSRTSTAKQQALQYAVNFMSGALATYRDFDFDGFTHDEGESYAWRRDGLYRLGCEPDEAINALVDFGATDYGDAHLKRLAMAFVGVRSDGDCYIRLCADNGVERVYKLLGEGGQKRAQPAKGIASRYWNVRLELTDATFASVDNIELEVGVTQRRGYGRRG